MRQILLPSLLAMALTGCTGVARDGGFSGVQALAATHSSLALRWATDAQSEAAIAALVQQLLAQPLDAQGAAQLALLNNRAQQARYAQVGIAQADLVQTGKLANPVFHGLWVRNDGVSRIEHSLTFDLMSLLLLPLERRLGQARFEQVKAEVAAQALDFAAETKAMYYEAAAAAQSVKWLERVLLSAEAGADLANAQREAGSGTERDLHRHRALLSDARIALGRARRAELARAEQLARQLGLAAGLSPGQLAELPELPAAAPVTAALETVALEQRLDVEAARRAVDAAGEALGITRLSRFVDVREVGVARWREGNDGVLRGPLASVGIPLLDFGEARAARGRWQAREAADSLAATLVRARSDIRQACADVASTHALALEQEQEQMPRRQRVLAQTQFYYNANLEGAYNLLADYREAMLAGREAIEARRDYWVALANLERAAGGRLPVHAAPAASREGDPKP